MLFIIGILVAGFLAWSALSKVKTIPSLPNIIPHVNPFNPVTPDAPVIPGGPIKPPFPFGPTPNPTPAQATPIEQFKSVVTAPTVDKEKALRFGYLLFSMAELVSRVDSIQSTVLRDWLVAADTYYFQGTDLVGSIPGAGAAKDKVLEEAVGLEAKLLTKPDLEKVVMALWTMSQICGVK